MRMSVNARKLHFDTGLNYRRHYYGKISHPYFPKKGHGKIWLAKHIAQWSKIHLCHNYVLLKYSFLIASAFAISLLGAFLWGLMMP